MSNTLTNNIYNITVNYRENGAPVAKPHVLNPTEIPRMSHSTISILEGAVQPNTDLAYKHHLNFRLKEKVETLIDTTAKLQNAKDHQLRDSIFAVLISALAVAILAGGVFLTISTASVSAVIMVPFLTFIAYFPICMYNYVKLQDGPAGVAMGWKLALLTGTPFLSLYEIFTRISRLENSIQIQQEEIENTFSNAITFFKEHDLETKLTDSSDALVQACRGLENLRELNDMQTRVASALEEYKAAREYFLSAVA